MKSKIGNLYFELPKESPSHEWDRNLDSVGAASFKVVSGKPDHATNQPSGLLAMKKRGKLLVVNADQLMASYRKHCGNVAAVEKELGYKKGRLYYHCERLGLVSKGREAQRKPIPDNVVDTDVMQDSPMPMSAAHSILGSRLTERRAGYFIDGQPVSLDTIMQETNRLRKAAGLEQITNCERWRV